MLVWKLNRIARRGGALLLICALLMAVATPIAHAQDDVEEANKATVERFFNELINEGNLDIIDELVAPNYVEHWASEDTVYADPQALKDEWEGIFAEMSPIEFQIDDMMADGDRVITQFTASALGGKAVWSAIGITRLEDGKIVEYSEEADQLSMMTQMGMLPDPGAMEADREVVARAMDEVYNQHNLDNIEDLFTPTFVDHTPFEEFESEDYDTLRAYLGMPFSDMPDLTVDVSDIIVEGDRAAVRFTMSSEEAGVEVGGAYILRLEDGRIAEGWDYTDLASLLSQLGIIEIPQEPEIVSIGSGFTSPQGVLVDADGNVWVVDGGTGGEDDVDWMSPDSGEVEPGKMGETAQVAMITPDGEQTVVANLPSIAIGSDFLGGAGIALLDGELYVTVGQWLGELGDDRLPLEAAVARVNADGTVDEVATTWDAEIDNPDGTVVDTHPYGLTAGPDGLLWVADAGGNDLLTVDPATGEVTVVAVFDGIPGPLPNPNRDNAMESDPVPTGVAFGDDGTVYVSLLGGFPFVPGSTKVVTVDADGNVEDYATGLTMLTDLRMGPDGNLYAVSFGQFTEQGPIPNAGAIVRIMEGDASEVVLSDLSFPTSIDFNSAGDAYITINGVGAPGSGEVVMVAGLTDLPGTPLTDLMPSE